MVIFLNLDGSAQKVVPERIFQGTNNVIAIDVIAPYAPTTALEIAFTLPNREQTAYMPMTYVSAVTCGTLTASAWEYVLQSNVTEYEGTVLVSINAIGKNGNKTSYAVNFNVERSILPDLPPAPTPDVYQLLLQYVQQNTFNILKLDRRVKTLENATVRTVLKDFTVNSITGEGIKYYSDGTTATVQFPVGGTAPPVQSNWLKVISFSSDDFNEYNELAFSPQQTGFFDSKYLALLDRVGTYEVADEIEQGVHEGFWQTANTFFKGTDGSIYMQFNKPFSGRLVLLGGAVFSGNFIATVKYRESDNALVFTKVDGTEEVITLPQSTIAIAMKDLTVNSETGAGVKYYTNGTTSPIQFPTPAPPPPPVVEKFVKYYTIDDWQGSRPSFTISISAQEHGHGVNPLVNTGTQVFSVFVNSDGAVTFTSTRKTAFKLIIV